MRFGIKWLLSGVLFVTSAGIAQAAPVFSSPIAAADSRDFLFQGEYWGEIRTESGLETMACQVRSLGKRQFRVIGYNAPFPGATWPTASGKLWDRDERKNGRIEVKHPNGSLHMVIRPGYASIHNEKNERIGLLQRTTRRSPTLGKEPPENAKVLFDGKSLAAWRDGASKTPSGLLKPGATTKDSFGDIYLHIEFRCPFMPRDRRANSGIYLQNLYEIQVLDSFAGSRRENSNGAIYGIKAPKYNVSCPSLSWQTFDIWFTAPDFNDSGQKIANAEITMEHNGVAIHKNVKIPHGTAAKADQQEVPEGPLHLQNYAGIPVRYRNIWLVEDPK